MAKVTNIDIDTEHGTYRRETGAGPGRFVVHMYCGHSADDWTILDGSSEQIDLEMECADAIKKAAQIAREAS